MPHFVWATHESLLTEVADALALKVPVGQGLHTGLAVALPAVAVYLPAPHLLWTTHESVLTEVADALTLKNPDAQGLHTGPAVVLPAVAV